MSSPAGVVRNDLLSAPVETALVTHVEATEVTLPPGLASGRHRHQMTVVGYVTSGRIRFQPAGLPPKTLRAGQAFHEPAQTVIDHFDNDSATEPATFIAFYLKATRGQPSIDMLPPDG